MMRKAPLCLFVHPRAFVPQDRTPSRVPPPPQETGVPFDLGRPGGGGGRLRGTPPAYATGDWRAPLRALDTTLQALDRTLLSWTLWNYTPAGAPTAGAAGGGGVWVPKASFENPFECWVRDNSLKGPCECNSKCDFPREIPNHCISDGPRGAPARQHQPARRPLERRGTPPPTHPSHRLSPRRI